jgi:hypothetical protein
MRSDLYRSESFDLLRPGNNAWRVKPSGKENKIQIQKRVGQHVDFLLGYFTMIEEKSQDYFDTSVLQTPFEFYSNGMALPSNFDVDDVWASNFYDEEDAAEGARLLTRGLTSIEVYPSDSKSYSKGYYNALKLVKEFVEK